MKKCLLSLRRQIYSFSFESQKCDNNVHQAAAVDVFVSSNQTDFFIFTVDWNCKAREEEVEEVQSGLKSEVDDYFLTPEKQFLSLSLFYFYETIPNLFLNLKKKEFERFFSHSHTYSHVIYIS